MSNFLANHLANLADLPILGKYLVTMFISMLPLIEERGAIPVAIAALNLHPIEALVTAFIGNIIPVYFIVKYIHPIFDFFGKFKPLKKIIDWATDRANKKIAESKLIEDFVFLALFVFVAIPLPGTGAWIGSLIANFLGLPPKKAMPPIFLGVLAAGLIMTFGTLGIKSLI